MRLRPPSCRRASTTAATMSSYLRGVSRWLVPSRFGAIRKFGLGVGWVFFCALVSLSYLSPPPPFNLAFLQATEHLLKRPSQEIVIAASVQGIEGLLSALFFVFGLPFCISLLSIQPPKDTSVASLPRPCTYRFPSYMVRILHRYFPPRIGSSLSRSLFNSEIPILIMVRGGYGQKQCGRLCRQRCDSAP